MLFRKAIARRVLSSFALVAWSALPALAAPEAEYTAGHVDIGVKYDANGFDLRYNFAADGVIDGSQVGSITEVDPADVYTRAGNGAQLINAPSDGAWSFLGTEPGDDIWALPQSNVSGEPFLGTSGEDLDASSNWNGDINYEFTGVTRPSGAHFSLYQTDIFGNPTAFVATQDGLSDNLSVPVGSHSHYNWAFTKEGVYQVEVTASGERTSGESVQETEVFWFAVGDSADPTDPTVYDYEYGHGHIGLNYNVQPPDPRDRDGDTTNDVNETLNNDGGLFPHVGIPGGGNHDTNLPMGGPYNPADVTHIVPDSTRADRSHLNQAVSDALGSPVTDDVWILPESESDATSQNAPWTGPAVAPDAYSQFDDIQGDDGSATPLGNVQWTLSHVDGPGEVALWTNDQFGNPELWMASGDGLDPVGGDDTVLLGSGGAHNNWAFTEMGLYHLTFQWDVQVDGTPLRESATFAFEVVPEPMSVALLGGGAMLLLRRRR